MPIINKLLFPFLLLISLSANSQCTANFYFLNPTGLTVDFRDTSIAGPGIQKLLYSWWFNDGTASSSIANPSHTFSSPGTYLVTLSVSDSLNTCFDSTSRYVTVNFPRCNAAFNYQIIPDGDSSIVNFTNQSINYSDSAIFRFDFGDGSFYVTQATGNLNPSNTYSPGSFIAQLSIIDSLYNTSCSFLDSLIIPVNPKPCTTDFAYSIIPQQDSSQVDFVNLSVDYDSTSYFNYDFGDGSQTDIPASSQNLNTSHTYAPGDYLFTLSVIDSISGDSCSKSDSINIPFNPFCDAAFDFNIDGDSVVFTNLALGFTSIKYFFGDGDSSEQANPVHLYPQSNIYTVTQIVFDSLSGCRDTAIQTINVTISTSCVANFIPAIDTLKKQLLYLVNQSSELNTHQYLWEFGDGNISTEQYPIHNYENFGAYQICLTVSDPSLNCMNLFCDTIGLDSNSQVINKNGGFTLQVLDGGSIGLEENIWLESMSVFPNPVSERLYINLPNDIEGLRFRLFAIDGKLLQEGIINKSSPHLEFNDYQDGVFLLTLSYQNQFKKFKILKME